MCIHTIINVVNFFRTHGGVHNHEDKLIVTAPTIMWVKALDMVLERLKLEGLDFSTVVAVSGAAQVMFVHHCKVSLFL